MVTSDWPYLRWLCRYGENCVCLTEWWMAVKLQLERHSRRHTGLGDARNPIVTPDWPYFRWFRRYSENCVCLTEWWMAVKLQLERHSRRHTGLLDAVNPMVTPNWPYLGWFCRYGENYPRFLRLFNGMTNGRKTTVRTPFRKVYRHIGCGESNGNLRLAIYSLVLPLWRKSPLISAFI